MKTKKNLKKNLNIFDICLFMKAISIFSETNENTQLSNILSFTSPI